MTVMRSLKLLHENMKTVGVDAQTFFIRAGAAEFDGRFSVRSTPYALALTSRGLNPQFFLFDVDARYCVRDFFGPDYERLRQVLRLDGRTGDRLMPKSFFAQIDSLIPTDASRNREPRPEDIVRTTPGLEDSDKPYFDHWHPHSVRRVTKTNLRKTREALGVDAYHYSLRENTSSCWSAIPLRHDWRKQRR